MGGVVFWENFGFYQEGYQVVKACLLFWNGRSIWSYVRDPRVSMQHGGAWGIKVKNALQMNRVQVVTSVTWTCHSATYL